MNNTVHIPQWGKPQIPGWAVSYKDIAPYSPIEPQSDPCGVVGKGLVYRQIRKPGVIAL
jgi:hypothetical protein